MGMFSLNDINIDSDFLKISNYENEPAYFSINTAEIFTKLKVYMNSIILRSFKA